MLGYTKLQIMGNLGGTPEMKFLPSGEPLMKEPVQHSRKIRKTGFRHQHSPLITFRTPD